MSNPISQTHPHFFQRKVDWETMRDTYEGERAVKARGTVYLPATSGMIADGQGTNADSIGEKMYQAYKTRSVFPDNVANGVEALLGILHRKPPKIQLPPQMEEFEKSATTDGESLLLLLRKINEAQLVSGRVGLLADLPSIPQAKPRPYIAAYNALNIINWDDGRIDDPVEQTLNLVVLDESEQVRVGFTWKREERFRVLYLGELNENEISGVYHQQIFKENKEEGGEITPTIRGKQLKEIPFVFINSKDMVVTPDKPPLLGLADLVLAIYRGEADLRQALFNQGQDTLVITGGEEDKTYRLGAGAAIVVPLGGDAKMIGVDSTGLSEMRHVLENDKKMAALKGAQLIDTTSRQRESGDALRIRVAAQTATLTQIAFTGAEGLKRILQVIARWMGADPDAVIIEPNTDFSSDEMSGKELIELQTAKSLGAPISDRSIHDLMKRRGLTQRTLEEELDLIEAEMPKEPALLVDPRKEKNSAKNGE